MRRDYKTIIRSYFQNDFRLSDDIIPEEYAMDLYHDSPDNKLSNIIDYLWKSSILSESKTLLGFNYKITEDQLEWFCKSYSDYEFWAQCMFTVNWDKLYTLVNKDENLAWIFTDTNKEYARKIDKIFNYYHKEVEPGQTLKNMPDISSFNDNTGQDHVSSIKKHDKTLIETINELPQYSIKTIDNDFIKVRDTINSWIDCEFEICDQELFSQISETKHSKYLLEKVTNLLKEFNDYIPRTRNDWKQMRYGQDTAYYCWAIESYINMIGDLRLKHCIEKDVCIKKIYNLTWFYFNTNPNESIKDNAPNNTKPVPTAQNKKLKEFLDAVADYAESYQDNVEFNKTDFYYDKITEWVELNIKKLEDDFVHTVAHDKMSMYLFNLVRNLLDEFRDYLPHSCEEFTKGQNGEYWYYYEALVYYIDSIIEDINYYDIDVDKYINMVYDMTKYFNNHLSDDISDNQNIFDYQNGNNTIDLSLPEEINTEHVMCCLKKAIDAHYIKVVDNSHLVWLGDNGKKVKARLAYFCGLIFGYNPEPYCVGDEGGHVSYTAFETLFGVTRLDRALNQVYEAKNAQRWREIYDKLLQ